METMKMPFQFGSIQQIYNKALKIAQIAHCAVEFDFNGQTFCVDYRSEVYNQKHADVVFRYVKEPCKAVVML